MYSNQDNQPIISKAKTTEPLAHSEPWALVHHQVFKALERPAGLGPY